jgi:hypothetical protein
VTDDLATYGLGALPDPPDERDYPLSALYAAEGLTATVALPASCGMPLWRATGGTRISGRWNGRWLTSTSRRQRRRPERRPRLSAVNESRARSGSIRRPTRTDGEGPSSRAN